MNTLIGAVMASRGSSMIAFFGFLFAVALSAGGIGGEVERGVLSIIVSKPVGRNSIYLGKWIGVNLFILPFIFLWTGILQWAIWKHVAFTVPGLWRADAVIALYPAVFSALTLLFSALTSTLMATVLPLIVASAAWSEGMLKFFAHIFDVASLKTLARVVVYVAPLNPLSRWVERLLDQPILDRLAMLVRLGGPPDPPAGLLDLWWILGYGAAMLALGLVVFARRDVAS
jgi:ABC-type transport system involved in multi-copper enzyme maturation permease subunit